MNAPLDSYFLIDGRRTKGPEYFPVVNPADTAETVGHVPAAGKDDVARAVEAAAAAFPAWSNTPLSERIERLRRAAQAVAGRIKDLVPLLVRENGKLLREAEVDIRRAVEALEYACNFAEEFEAPQSFETKDGKFLVVKKPRGVTAVVAPWNFPVVLTFRSLAPALVTGNTAVVKPPSLCPLALTEVIRIVSEHLPPGVINLITGKGSMVGKELITHPLVRMISFTGSTETGKEVMRDAAGGIKKLALELGGNDPAILLEDAPLDEPYLQGMIRGIFTASGQVCFAIKRIYVHQSIYRDFLGRFSAALDKIVVGNGLDEKASMGAIINEPQLRALEGLVREARERGAQVEVLGKKLNPDAWGRGHFHLPTLVTGADQSFSIVRCEQFGPVIPVIPFKTTDEAVRWANDTEYGLRSSVWTRDEKKGLEVAKKLEAGITFLNNHSFLDRRVNFPGVKESGLGRESIHAGLEAYVDYQGISIPKA